VDDATAAQVAVLGRWASELRWDAVPPRVHDRLRLVLLDVLGVTVVGARDPEQRRLVGAWELGPGPSPVFGAGASTSVEAAAWLNATALVRLELDEGNKFAKGHPAAHGFPAVLALAAARRVEADQLLAALLVAYEVASRFGRATTLRAGMHPHGSWGVAGAAAGCAKILGLDAAATAAAIDAGTGMPIAAHFTSALDGNRVRDAWMGASNLSGLSAARMAVAGLAVNTGTAAQTLGELLGTMAPAELTAGLGTRWDIELGYFKQHAACSFTHPAADAVLALRGSGRLPVPESIDRITVETHSLAGGLNRATWSSRLSAMFSIPFVVAAAAVHGSVTPDVSEGSMLEDPRVRRLAERVEVRTAADLDARLPDERAVRLTVVSADASWVEERPNPVGDSAFEPFDESGLRVLLTGLMGGEEAWTIIAAGVDRLFSGGGAVDLDVIATVAAGDMTHQPLHSTN
jgi:2-methylcitrate dehydratase PrpD